ncbi:IS30 family transposase [Domibacillus sp. A3M-37]|nr:IS30 family transposase [Domibacillus sp. A3M-37]
MKKAICSFIKCLPKKTIHMDTTERGKEFSCYFILKKDLNIAVFFTDPYSSWQFGSNENVNGLLREFFPKEKGSHQVTEEARGESI